MTSKRNKERAAKAAMRKYKKRPNTLNAEKVDYIDYKDVTLLQRFMSDRSKLKARRMNGNSVQQQRDVALAVKNAREMALLPYTKRVASARAPRRGEEDGSTSDRPRRDRSEASLVDTYADVINAEVGASEAVEESTVEVTEEA
jgi:small subunit ribosomal protein S18